MKTLVSRRERTNGMATILKRTALFGIYGVVSCGVVWLFAGGGEGSFLPLMVFASWAIPIARLIWPGLLGVGFFLVLYYSFLLIINTVLSRRTRGVLATLTVHFAGVAVAALGKKGASLLLPSWVIFLLSALIVLLYLWTDWRLARARMTLSAGFKEPGSALSI